MLIFSFISFFLHGQSSSTKSQQAPNVTLHLVTGQDSLQLSTLKGKSVMLAFWSIYDIQYDNFLSQLSKISSRYPKLKIIAVNTDDTPDSLLMEYSRKFTRLTLAWDKNGQAFSSIQAHRTPAIYLIDQYGIIRKQFPEGIADLKKLNFALRGLVDHF